MKVGAALVLVGFAAAAAGCVRQVPGPVASGPHYVLGGGYQMGGSWYYPRENFHSDQTGLAAVLPDKGGVTADGEAYDGRAMVGAHQTLQLPAIVRVTNLDSGLQALVRVNDRGPDAPGRVIGLSRRAAEVLGVTVGQVPRVRVQVEEGPSLRLRQQLGAGPSVQVSMAPRASVATEALLPPPGIGQSRRGRTATGAVTEAAGDFGAAEAVVPEWLPTVATQVSVTPGQLMLRAGSFGRMEYARALQTRLGGLRADVERVRDGRTERFEVLAGPFGTVAAADSALDQAMRAGVGDARIVVE